MAPPRPRRPATRCPGRAWVVASLPPAGTRADPRCPRRAWVASLPPAGARADARCRRRARSRRSLPLALTRAPVGAGLQGGLQNAPHESAPQSQIARAAGALGTSFRPTPALPSRTHVPPADDDRPIQALAPRAPARRRRNGARVRDAGRGNPWSVDRGTGSPAGRRGLRPDRPHRRASASSPSRPSAARPPPRCGRGAQAGLSHAGSSPGTATTDLTARRPPGLGGRARHRAGAPRGRRASPPLGPPIGRPEW
jgi:hypothetical protein